MINTGKLRSGICVECKTVKPHCVKTKRGLVCQACYRRTAPKPAPQPVKRVDTSGIEARAASKAKEAELAALEDFIEGYSGVLSRKALYGFIESRR